MGDSEDESKKMAEDERECPRCAEIIKKKAIACRFCNADLAAPKTQPQKHAMSPEEKAKNDRINRITIACWVGVPILLVMITWFTASHSVSNSKQPEAPAAPVGNSEKFSQATVNSMFKSAQRCVRDGDTYLNLHDYKNAKSCYQNAQKILSGLVADGHSEFQPVMDELDGRILQCKQFD